MSAPPPGAPASAVPASAVPEGRLIGRAIALILVALWALTAIELGAGDRGQADSVSDFLAFATVGRLAGEGALADAYHYATLRAAMIRLFGADAVMLWSYPPHYDLVVQALAHLPVGPAYALFAGTTALLYWQLIRRLAGPAQPWVMLALFPALVACIRIGQNGFLTGSLVALYALQALKGRALAGVPLALLTIKPNFLPGPLMHVLVQWRWRTGLLAAALALAIIGVATWWYGAAIWPRYRAGLAENGAMLAAGLYPLYRMTSVYAFVRTHGFGPDVAIGVQGVVSLFWAGGLLWMRRQGWPPHQQLAAALMAAQIMSPYAFDYDLPILGVAVALLAGDVAARTRAWQRALLLAAAWLAGGAGAALYWLAPVGPEGHVTADNPSLGIVGVLLLCVGLIIAARQPVASRFG